MKVVPEHSEAMDRDFNYLDVKNQTFVFNNFKTKKTYGTQTEKIPDELFEILKRYVIPSGKKFEPTLIFRTYQGEVPACNYITRLLNSVFNKNVSASMLRNIFLTHKLGGKKSETQDLASAMGTSANTIANVYTKED